MGPKIFQWKMLHDFQRETLKNLVILSGGTRVIEVGSWVGESACLFASVAKKVFCVDHFQGDQWTKTNGEDVLALFRQNIKYEGCNNVNILVMDSISAASIFPNGFADLIYIDAGHTYDSVLSDIIAWSPKVRPGGIICGHDCEDRSFNPAFIHEDFVDGKHHGVIKAVFEAFPDASIENQIWIKVRN